jgi:4-hydroxy-4-methyl-2-oxoglutarate aldolase
MGPAFGRAAVMCEAMRPLIKGIQVVGPAVTAFCVPGDNLMMHRALDLAQEGDVLVVTAPDSGAQWGELAATYARKKRLAAIVVDGFIRDIDQLTTLRSPVWATRIGPSSPSKSGHGFVNAPVVCAGVRVEPGDLIVADGDGVIVVPKMLAMDVVAAAKKRMEREETQRAEIEAGARPWTLYGAAENYARLDVQEIDGCWDSSNG